MPEIIVHFVIVRPEGLQGKPLRGIPIQAMMGEYPSSEKNMPSPNTGSREHPGPESFPDSPSTKPIHVPSIRAQWITGAIVLGVMVFMGALGLGLALWTQPQRRARDLPRFVAGPDRLVESVAFGADLVIWAKGDFPAGNDRLMDLLPESVSAKTENFGDKKNRAEQEKGQMEASGTGTISGCRFMAIPEALGVGKSSDWALSRTFGQKYPNKSDWVRLSLQLESTYTPENRQKTNEIVLPGPGVPGIVLVQKSGFLEWRQMGGKFMAALGVSLGVSPGNSLQGSQSTAEYGGTLSPDFLELRVGRIPHEAPAWVIARGGMASRHAAKTLLGYLPEWNRGDRDFPADEGVFGLWEEAGNLRAEWIFAEQSAADNWEKVLWETKPGSKWKWIRQGKVISLQREGGKLWSR